MRRLRALVKRCGARAILRRRSIDVDWFVDRRRVKRWLVAVGLAVAAAGQAGCFSPHFEHCAVACGTGADQACPPGSTCMADGMCHGAGDDALCRISGDGGPPDGGISDDGGAIDASADAAPAVSPTTAGDLVISEIMKNPSTPNDADGEWFELYNPTSMRFDLQGTLFEDRSTDSFDVDQSVVVEPGGRVVLGYNGDVSANGGVVLDFDYSDTFRLGNSSDEIVMLSASGDVVIDEVDYNVSVFPSASDTALSLDPDHENATDNDIGTHWCDATAIYGDGDLGTPGAANPPCP